MDINALFDYRKRGLLKSQAHPNKNLVIWNYDQKVQIRGDWDDITLKCRGLVTDCDGKIIARSFNKFFNIEENRHQATEDFEVYAKIDGSLGLIFYHEGSWETASRGSFISDQAKQAGIMLDANIDEEKLDKTLTYVVEILYPENRIVVDYNARRSLVFLSAFRTNGEEVFLDRHDLRAAGFEVVERYDFEDYKVLKELNWANSEGFVVRFSNGDRVKIKFEQYLAMHRVVTNMSSSTLFEWFKEGSAVLEERLKEIPDEFYESAKHQWKDFQERYDKLFEKATNRISEIGICSAKDFAFAIKDDENKAILFALRNHKEVRKIICKSICYVSIMPQLNFKTLPTSTPRPGLLILVGPAGSGKTTWARNYVRGRSDTRIVSRDSLRQQLFGYDDRTISDYYADKYLHDRETCVTKSQFVLMKALLEGGSSVVVDDTNLLPAVLDRFIKTFRRYEIKFKVFDNSLGSVISRNANRTKRVDESVVRNQWDKFERIKSLYDLSARVPTRDSIKQTGNLPAAFVVDIDGTLALRRTRHVYEWDKVKEDIVNEPVRDVYLALRDAGFRMVICTARDWIAGDATRDWLLENGMSFDEFFIRTKNDRRPDYVVKEEFWRDIALSYHIRALLDDRDQVVDHARSLGLACFQVAYGNF